MKAPTSLLDRPGRAAAVVGTMLAVSAGTTMVLVATASADEPGRCVTNVNVREQPDITSRIVALCEEGTEVQVGETRDGFVQLTNLGGWSAQQYVSVAGRPPAAPADPAPSPSDGSAPDDDATGGGGAGNSAGDDGAGDDGAGSTADDAAGATPDEATDEAGDEAGSVGVPGTDDADEEPGSRSGFDPFD